MSLSKVINVREISLYIARNPEKVIEEIKGRDCVLNNLVKPCPDLKELELFVTHHYWSNSESVNVFLVVGTSRLDCDGKVSWIDFLKCGKKMPLNLKLLAENPDYYFETRKKEPVMHYVKVNDEIFVGGREIIERLLRRFFSTTRGIPFFTELSLRRWESILN